MAVTKLTPVEVVRNDLVLDIFKIEAKGFVGRLSNGFGMCNRGGAVRDDFELEVDKIIYKISLNFFFFFERETEQEGGRERERDRESQAGFMLSEEPDAGLLS